MVSNKKVIKSGFWYVLANFLNKGIVFLTTPIFTRLLTKGDFGLFNNFLSWESILLIIVTLNLESTLIRAKFDYKKHIDSYILSMIVLSWINTLIWYLIINFNNTFFISLFGIEKKYINLMFLYMFFLPVVNIFQTRASFLFEYKASVFVSILLSISTAVGSVLLIQVLPDKLFGRIIGLVLPAVILGIVFSVYFVSKGKKIRISYWKYAIPICLPYVPHLLSMTVLNAADRIMINKFCGVEETALYSLAYTCGTVVTLFATSLNGAFSPWLGEMLNNRQFKQIRKVSYIYIGLFFFLALGIILLTPEVLFILGGKSYMDAIYVLAPVSMGCCFQFLYTMFVNVEQFEKETLGMAIGSVVAATVNFVLNYIFIPRFGYLAAAYTTLFSFQLLLLIHMYLVKRIGLKEVYDYKFIYGVVVIGILLMFVIIVLYNHIVIRYICVILYALFFLYLLLKNKDKVLLLFKERRI